MGVDRPDEADVPSFADGALGRSGSDASAGVDPPGRQAEVRDRCEYYESLRVAVQSEPADARNEGFRGSASLLARGDDLLESPAGFRVSAETPDAIAPEVSAETPSLESRGPWDEAVERFRGAWAEHRARWPDSERQPVDRSGDPPGSWRGDSGRYLDSAANAEVEKRCDRIAEAEQNVISPAMREIEACDPSRHLVGFEHRLKGQDRLKDKVAADMEEKGRTATESLSMVKDTIRYTFVYTDESYASGVRADVARMEARGFQQIERRNTWSEDQYKGINSRWRDRDTGQLFEVQFHTDLSFEAKQLTHCVYERTRSPGTDRAELRDLRRLQGNTCRQIPIPPGVSTIQDRSSEDA